MRGASEGHGLLIGDLSCPVHPDAALQAVVSLFSLDYLRMPPGNSSRRFRQAPTALNDHLLAPCPDMLLRGDHRLRRYEGGPVTLTTAPVAVAEPDGVVQLTVTVLLGPL